MGAKRDKKKKLRMLTPGDSESHAIGVALIMYVNRFGKINITRREYERLIQDHGFPYLHFHYLEGDTYTVEVKFEEGARA